VTALLHLAVFLLAFAAMEGVAWAVHRYVMHGWGWGWHRSHHEPRRGWFEANDLYAIAFAALATALFFVGAQPGLRWVWFAGLGMTAYGVAYALAHDGLVHQRFFRFTPKRGYLKRLVQAHRLHHATHGRHGGVSFGFLWAPDPRKLKARLRELEAARAAG
jgi:beta-carotene 3-hydroxylase